jgi:hypothetical protein
MLVDVNHWTYLSVLVDERRTSSYQKVYRQESVGAMSRRQDVERVDQSTTTKVRIDVDYGDLVRELLDGGCGTTNNPAVQLGDEDRRAKYI